MSSVLFILRDGGAYLFHTKENEKEEKCMDEQKGKGSDQKED